MSELRETPLLIISKADGSIVYQGILAYKTTSLSSDSQADVVLKNFEFSLFISPTDRSTFLIRDANKKGEQIEIFCGRPIDFHNYKFLILKKLEEGKNNTQQIEKSSPDFLNDLIQLIQAPPSKSGSALAKNIQNFLDQTIKQKSIKNAFLVSCVGGVDYQLVAYSGIDAKTAESLWNKMPENLIQDILRKKSKIILPQHLQGKRGDETTVYVGDIGSVVGFPVVCQGVVDGILCMGFENIVKDLDVNLQLELERAADLVGVLLQFYILRDEIDVAKTSLAAQKVAKDRLMVGVSNEISEVYKNIQKLAPIDFSLLINGETGTGKELVAREIHLHSSRNKCHFVAVNCASIPESLLEAHLFGYKKGAFTGAISDHEGLVAKAHQGSLFLDEIGEIPLNIQVKLLRVLQEKLYMKVGDNKELKSDFRLISATHKDLLKLVAEGQFRQDLYYRVAGAVIKVPALRERKQDIMVLAKYFKQKFIKANNLPDKTWSNSVRQVIEAYNWPGNIRQLDHEVCRAVVMSEGEKIRAEDFSAEISGLLSSLKTTSIEDSHSYSAVAKESIEFAGADIGSELLADAKDRWLKAYIEAALQKFNGNRADTANALGIGQRTLFRYIEQFKIKEN
ncbi:MAG: sigma-54-dependent Fis family transcriptional regulator [Oligoflexales bacterium]|nr:sigma-54-dependent Fis family transcriptional regulator [Oligoflexales bacterium]